MAERLAAATAAKAERSDLADAVKEAVIAAGIAFVLFVGIVGIKMENGQEGLNLIFRVGSAVSLAIAVGIVRLLFDLFVWRRFLSRGKGGIALTSANLALILRIAVAGFYLIGAVYFLVPNSRDTFAESAAGIFASPEWQDRARIFVKLTGFLFLTVFVVISSMMIVMAIRRLWQSVRSGASRAQTNGTHEHNLIGEFGQQFAPALLAIAVILPILVAGPQQRYALDTATQVLTYIMLGWGLNIVVGLAGLLDLGYVAFYAVGAYAYALLATTFGWSFWLCLPLAGLLAATWGVILGFPVLRLRGDYLAIVTLAFGEMVRIVLVNWYSLTRGPDGITRIPKISFFGLSFDRFGSGVKFHEVFGLEYSAIYRIIFLYYVILALALIVNFATHRLRRLPLGRAWEALREDEIACRSLGINITITKLTAFATGAMFGGFAGSFFATRQGFISPESFTFQESALVLAIVVLGGLGSQIGVVIAAVVLIGSSEFFRELQDYRMLIFGLSMVTIMVWRPRGLVGTRVPSIALKQRKAISRDLVREGAG